jgi:hypothetical protein
MIGPLVFKLCTPFALEETDDQPFAYAPLVCGYLEYDNSHSGATAELIFGMGAHATPFDSMGARGWQFDSSCGFATEATNEVHVVEGRYALSLDIGPLSALKFIVPPHGKRLFPLVLAWHAYDLYARRWFPDLPSVLEYGLKNHERYIALSDQRDAEFMRSSASFDEKSRLARDTRTWLAATHRRVGDPAIDLSPLEQIAARIRSHVP